MATDPRPRDLLALVRGIFGPAFRISRWYIPGHDGIDLPAAEGTPIRAAATGRVTYARDARTDPDAGKAWAIGGGNVVNIDIGGGMRTQYAHLAKMNVRSGDIVQKGQIIGTVGKTGNTAGAHLHFGLWDVNAKKMINPTGFLTKALSGPVTPGDVPIGNLGGWGDLVSFPDGKILTRADIDTIMSALVRGNFFSGPDGIIAQEQTRAVLVGFVGQPWNKTTQDAMQRAFGIAAQNAGGLGAAIAPIGALATEILDPGNWVRILALFVGLGIAGYGAVNVLRATA